MGNEPPEPRRGWLKNGNPPGDWMRRCRMHGGLSTGPRTLEGRESSKRARWTPGSYSAEAERELRRLKAECASFSAVQQGRHAASFAGLLLKVPDLATFESHAPRLFGDKEWQAHYQMITPLVESGYREVFSIVE